MINCKETTILVVKKEAGLLSARERLRLAIHLMICKYCRWFSRQNKIINKMAHKTRDMYLLSETKKAHLLDNINKQL